MATPRLSGELIGWINRLAVQLDRRNAWRLLPIWTGLLFATGRRTVSSWLRAGELSKDYQDYYYFLSSIGHNVKSLAWVVFRIALDVLDPSGRILLAIDDTPSKRYGPKVEGAGIHHNPTPGPAGSKYVYGHVWVTLAWVVRHSLWHTIGLPLLARLYVRRKDIEAQALTYRRQVSFQTKLEMAAELITWAAGWLKHSGRVPWVVADGAYAKRVVLKAAAAAGVVVVSRLRKDAALLDLPVSKQRRGRPAKYGKKSISLAKRAGHRQGWKEETFFLYGVKTTKRYKSFLATYPPAGGTIHVVLVKEDKGEWRAYFCTDVQVSVADILESVADRSALEQVFHDVKEVHGVGQAQTRNYWTNVAVYHLNLWLHTLIELWAWQRTASELTDRRLSPWDDADRRPSHADRRNALRRQCLNEEFRAGGAAAAIPPKITGLWRRLIRLVA